MFPPSVDAAVSESAIVEADSLLIALFLDGCIDIDARLIEVVGEKALESGKPMARSSKAPTMST